MSSEVKLPADCTYIANIHNKRKTGKTRLFFRRFSTSQYNQGGFDNQISDAYICQPGWEDDIKRWEKMFKREYFPYLERKKSDYKKATEWVNARYTEITCDHIKNTMEDIVRSEGLRIRRIKREYLQRLIDDKHFINEIRANPEAYTDII